MNGYEGIVFWLLVTAGAAQLVLCIASPAIPVVLGWREQLAPLSKLLREVFWTYAGYLLGSHLAFAVLSLAIPMLLLDHSTLAAVVVAFMATWWVTRLAIHLFGFDTSELPATPFNRFARHALGALFLFLSVVYVAALMFNLGVIP